MKLVLTMPVIKKDDKNRPRACIVTSSSFRFKRLIDNYIKDRYEAGITADMPRFPGGARRLLKEAWKQEETLEWIEQSVRDGAVKILLMIPATEGESEEESEGILKECEAVVRKRIPKIPIDLFAIRNDGLYVVER